MVPRISFGRRLMLLALEASSSLGSPNPTGRRSRLEYFSFLAPGAWWIPWPTLSSYDLLFLGLLVDEAPAMLRRSGNREDILGCFVT